MRVVIIDSIRLAVVDGENEDEFAELKALLAEDHKQFGANRLRRFSDQALLHFFDLMGSQEMITNVPSFVALRAEVRRRGLRPDDTRH